MKRSFASPAVALTALLLAAQSQAGEQEARLELQRGMYLQYTRGDPEGALRAYERASTSKELSEQAAARTRELIRVLGTKAPLVAARTRLDTKAEKSVDLGEARLMPAECEIVGRLDFRALMASPFASDLKVEAELESDGIDLEELADKIGFQPLRDISTVSMCATLDEKGTADMPVKEWLIIARGNFEGFAPGRLAAVLGAVSKDSVTVRRRTIKGTEALVLRIPLEVDTKRMEKVAIARPEKNLLMVGEPRALERALSVRNGKAAAVTANIALKPVLERIPSGATLWIAATTGQIIDKLKKAGKGLNLPAKMPDLEGMLLTVTLGNDIDVSAATRADDTESAKLLADIARGLIALAQLAPVDDPEVKKLLSGIRLEAKGLELLASIRVPGELVRREMTESRREEEEEKEIGRKVVKRRVKRIKLRLTLQKGDKKTVEHELCPGDGDQTGKLDVETEPAGVVRSSVDVDGHLVIEALKPGRAAITAKCGPGARLDAEVEVR
ncbi:MAG: hypothetical protein D6806_09490 [Deltaproteobacteria bacterium]|nr:MAG: hypothetical protein D6806_09490 [Deltaproteobacteria bacterium]